MYVKNSARSSDATWWTSKLEYFHSVMSWLTNFDLFVLLSCIVLALCTLPREVMCEFYSLSGPKCNVVANSIHKCRQFVFIYPVLKHGSRSPCKYASMWESTVMCAKNITIGNVVPMTCLNLRKGDGVRVYVLGPERWWTISEEGKARGNSCACSKRYWRANYSTDLIIGAKD